MHFISTQGATSRRVCIRRLTVSCFCFRWGGRRQARVNAALGAKTKMPKDTPSMAKNKIRRSLVAILDPHPSKSEVNELWAYFESRCAYCGTPIDRDSRGGHLDHLVPSAGGGSNNIHNHALSCARCNGDEKREESWLSFLGRKSENSGIFQVRKKRIEQWLSLMPITNKDREVLAEGEDIVREAIESFELSVEKMRALRGNAT